MLCVGSVPAVEVCVHADCVQSGLGKLCCRCGSSARVWTHKPAVLWFVWCAGCSFTGGALVNVGANLCVDASAGGDPGQVRSCVWTSDV
jgi:hypothetical protein